MFFHTLRHCRHLGYIGGYIVRSYQGKYHVRHVTKGNDIMYFTTSRYIILQDRDGSLRRCLKNFENLLKFVYVVTTSMAKNNTNLNV